MISVLVVEDDPVAGEAHELYVGRVEGFRVAGRVRTGQEALRFLEQTPVDLVLLDLRLPDMDGLAVARALRTAGSGADVIAVTSARDLKVVRASVASGVVQYLLKPFTFAAMREKLEHYARFRESLEHDREASGQHEIDRAFAALRDVNYVKSARLMGASSGRILVRQILPNTTQVLLPAITIGFNNAVLAEASMSYLGIGVTPPDASLGYMLSEAQGMLTSAPWYALGSGGAIVLLIFGVYLPVISGVKELLHLHFGVLPMIIVFGVGVICGALVSVKGIQKSLEKYIQWRRINWPLQHHAYPVLAASCVPIATTTTGHRSVVRLQQ